MQSNRIINIYETLCILSMLEDVKNIKYRYIYILCPLHLLSYSLYLHLVNFPII